MISVRPAISLDAASMAALLNAIIAEGGTTARTSPVKPSDLADWMAANDGRSAWHVAVDGGENVVGFQYIEPGGAYLPDVAAEIATFVQVGQTGLGIGSRLFEATRKAAKALGYVWINANIRSDNDGGLIYYQSRGFTDYGLIEGHILADGTVVNKTLKRFDL